MAESLISFTVATAKREAIDKAAGAERTTKIGERGLARWKTGAPAGVAIKDDGGMRQDFDTVNTLMAPATPEAQQWKGYGTALKPAHEPCVLARKPLIGTVAANVLQHGTGALNIDATRVATGDNLDGGAYSEGATERHDGAENWRYKRGDHGNAGAYTQPTGRFPANLLLTHHPDCRCVGTVKVKGDARVGQDKGTRPGGFVGTGADKGSDKPAGTLHGDETVAAWECVESCPVQMLDAQAGERGAAAPVKGTEPSAAVEPGTITGHRKRVKGAFHADKGGPSRFFPTFAWEADDFLPLHYCAKAAKKERSAGLDPEHFPKGCTHPTVKPVALMRWLCRLVTPPGGTVLDPFMGSGTTGAAAQQEGFNFIGIERDEGYMDIARARIEHHAPARPGGGIPVTVVSELRYGSVCSGIEAATVAWHPLGWRPAWFTEIDPFPLAVLAHHHPEVPNHGDFTQLLDPTHPARHEEPIDILVGGTPCQSFSVAGLRGGLEDPRGNLALAFVKLVGTLRPRWVVWENVPGALSADNGRAFGSILGALAGFGYGFAWRVLDAQYVRVDGHARAVPQRRRRVFLVGCAGGQFQRAAAVLFEPEGVFGDSPPRREAGAGAARGVARCARGGIRDVAPTLQARRTAGGGLGTDFDCDGGVLPIAFHATQDPISSSARSPCLSGGNKTGCASVAVAQVCSSLAGGHGGGAGHLYRQAGNETSVALYGMKVRRLTERECERLQGFPDDYTAIPWNGKPATECPSGHRYKALGNSMAVNVMRWIGTRIALVDALTMPVGGATLPPETGRIYTPEGAEAMEDGTATTTTPLPTRTFITSIDFALKNGGGSLEKLTPRILWIGTNGCGKSSWPDAVALAETGIADALAGKSRKDGTLFALSPAGALDEIFAKVTHSDGTKASWKTERVTKKHRDGTTSTTVKEPDQRGSYDPAMIFPLRPLLDALTKGGVDRQRRFFLDAAGGALDAAEIRVAVEKVLRANVENTEDAVTALLARYDQGIIDVTARKKLSATEALQALQSHAGAQQRQASDERDMATRTVNEAAAGLADNPDDAALTAAAEELELLTTQLQAAQEGIGSKGFSPFIEVADFRAEGQTNKAAMLQVQAELSEAEDIPEDEKAIARAKIMAALDILAHAHLEKELGKCFLCGEVPGVEALAARATTVIASVAKRRLADADAQADRQTYLDLQSRIEPLRKKLHRVRDAVPFIQQRERLAPLKYAAEKTLEELRGARAAHTGLAAARALVPVKAAAATEWASLAAVCKAVSKELLDGLAPAFAERVNRYMPGNWRFGLELFADGREVCNWGLLRCAECHGAGKVDGAECSACEGSGTGSVLHAFTSGGEWAGTLAAVAAATVPDDYDGLVILVVPDADFHPDVRRDVLEALVNFPGVVLATATQKPTGAKLKDWTYCTRQDDGSWKVQTGTKTIEGAKGAKVKKAGTKAANQDAKRSAGKAAKAKFTIAQTNQLEGLGYDSRQIERMSKATAKEIMNDGVSATGISILKDGSMMRPTQVDVDPGVDDLVVEPAVEPEAELPPEPEALTADDDNFDDLLD